MSSVLTASGTTIRTYGTFVTEDGVPGVEVARAAPAVSAATTGCRPGGSPRAIREGLDGEGDVVAPPLRSAVVDSASDPAWNRHGDEVGEPSLAAAWEANAAAWIAWAREPMHDVYERFHRDAVFTLLPAPGRRTLDLGCGEGRVARDLTLAGHLVVGVDRSPTLVAAARGHPETTAVVLGDAARLAIGDATVDLVVAFMSLQDVDRPAEALAEVARVLEPGGWAVVAVVAAFGSRFEALADRLARGLEELTDMTACTADEVALHITIDRAEEIHQEGGIGLDWIDALSPPTRGRRLLRRQGLRLLRPRRLVPVRRLDGRGRGPRVTRLRSRRLHQPPPPGLVQDLCEVATRITSASGRWQPAGNDR